MQKKLIALAVAGMVAAPLAMAQSNVTIYGLVDMGFNYQSSHSGIYDPVTDTVGNKAKSRTGLDNGLQSGSRIGFRGTEDLGNGLKAGFVLEYGINPDLNEGVGSLTGASSAANTRQSFITLSGDFGTVAAGRQYSPQFNLHAGMDPFGQSAVGITNIFAQNTRLDNTVAYVSPNFSGFSVTVAHSFNAAGTEVAKDGGNAKVWAISPRYTNGPIDARLNYHRIKDDASSTDVTAPLPATIVNANTTKVWDLGLSYDFGVVKPVVIYGQRKQSGLISLDDAIAGGFTVAQTNATIGTDSRYWLVGATAPVGEAGVFKISYGQAKLKRVDAKNKQWAIGYDHKLSARTNIYTAYAKRSGDYGVVSNAGAVTTAGGYKSQFNIGLRHMF